jgi:glycosyltransferase involved in cell wall biosynthesis
MRLLFISNLFPDTREPYRGLDNATVLHHLADRWDIRVLAVRPALPFRAPACAARSDDDRVFKTRYVPAPYVPRFGSRVNHSLMARALRGPVQEVQREFGIDVVLSSWIYPDSCAVSRLSEQFGFPFVSIAQGSDVHQYLQDSVRRKIIVQSMPRASAIITRSADLALQLAHAGLDARGLHAIHNGVDHSVFRALERDAARRALDIPLDVPVILFVGNFYPVKNPLLLIEAHAQVGDDPLLARTKLIMLGGGPLEARARQLAESFRFGRNVVFAGRKSPAEVAQYMQAADVLGLPSNNEGVPNVILESFACGLPVVATRVGGIPEVHPGDAYGRLVEPRNLAALSAALRAVLREPPLRNLIAAHGAQFTWQQAADEYHALLAAAAGA